MDFIPYIDAATRCLAGVVGTEGVNPTCITWGYPQFSYLLQFLSWSPVVLAAGVMFGGPIAVWLLWKLFEITRVPGE